MGNAVICHCCQNVDEIDTAEERFTTSELPCLLKPQDTEACHARKGVVRRAVAMQGGGFRALSSDVGLVAGLLAFGGLSLDQLFDKIHITSSGSGSTWFLTSLAYSPKFAGMVEHLAHTPDEAQAIFQTSYVDPANKIMWNDITIEDKVFAKVTEALLGSVFEWDAEFIASIRNLTWKGYVIDLLKSTADIDENLTLGDPVVSWAHGKSFHVNVSLLTPSDKKKSAVVWERIIENAGYRLNLAPEAPACLPASLTVMMSSHKNGLNAVGEPTAFVPGLPKDCKFDYFAHELPWRQEVDKFVDAPTCLTSRSAPMAAEKLEVSAAAAASSAAGGKLDIMPADQVMELLNLQFGIQRADLVCWLATNDSPSFKEADKAINAIKASSGSQGSATSLADLGVVGLVDAGVTEGTGVLSAISSGATYVVVVLNSEKDYEWSYVEQFFTGGKIVYEDNAELFPVFAQGVPDFSKFSEIRPKGVNSTLLGIKFGSVTVHTIGQSRARPGCRFFGISDVRKVQLDFINICSDTDIGPAVPKKGLDKYGVLVGDLVKTIAQAEGKDADAVRNVLLPMFGL